MMDIRFDEFTLTLILSGLKIEEPNHTGSYTEMFAFSSNGLLSYSHYYGHGLMDSIS